MWKLRHQYYDVTIICNQSKLRLTAHKVVLAAVCPALEAQLASTSTFCITDLSTCEVRSLLKCVYNGCQNSAAKLQVILAKAVFHTDSQPSMPQASLAQVVHLEDSQPSNSEPKKIHLFDLPNEILCHILSFLPTTEILTNVALVSTRFCDLAKDPSVHKVVRVRFQPISVICAATNDPLVINFVKVKIPSPLSLLDFLKSATQMKELYVDLGGNLFMETIDLLLLFISRHSQLRILWVEGDFKLTEQTFDLLQNAYWWTNLTKLNFAFDLIEKYPLSELYRSRFDQAMALLGSSGTMTHLGGGGTLWAKATGPAFGHLNSLALYDRFDLWDRKSMKEIILSRKNTIRTLLIDGAFNNHNFLGELPLLATLTVSYWHGSFQVLTKIKLLKSLDIEVYSSSVSSGDCNLSPKCLTALTTLKIHFGFDEEETEENFKNYVDKLEKVRMHCNKARL